MFIKTPLHVTAFLRCKFNYMIDKIHSTQFLKCFNKFQSDSTLEFRLSIKTTDSIKAFQEVKNNNTM